MKREIIVKLYDYPTRSTYPPTDLREHVAWLQGLLQQVPDDCLDTAYVEIDTGSSYDCVYFEYTVIYRRMETDDEVKERESKARLDEDAVRQREMAQLEALRAKYNL